MAANREVIVTEEDIEVSWRYVTDCELFDINPSHLTVEPICDPKTAGAPLNPAGNVQVAAFVDLKILPSAVVVD